MTIIAVPHGLAMLCHCEQSMSLVHLMSAHNSSANWAHANECLEQDLRWPSVEPSASHSSTQQQCKLGACICLNEDPTCTSVEQSASHSSTQRQCRMSACGKMPEQRPKLGSPGDLIVAHSSSANCAHAHEFLNKNPSWASGESRNYRRGASRPQQAALLIWKGRQTTAGTSIWPWLPSTRPRCYVAHCSLTLCAVMCYDVL